MALIVNPSDLKFKYPRDIARRDEPKFCGLPDDAPFNRHDLYEILPLLTAVMETLKSDDGRVLHLLEDLLNTMPHFLVTRGEVYDYLLGSAREWLRE